MGKVAIVTGGAGGLGGATVRRLASEGANVIVSDVAEQAGRALAKETNGTFIRHDVSSEAEWKMMTLKALELTGKIDILVNAAGIEGDIGQGGLSTTYANYRHVLSINLDGTFLGCMSVMPHMMAAGGGAIVNISSAVTFMATPSGLPYGISKAGVEQLSRTLAILGVQDGKKVRCNSVHPGVIKTRMTDSIVESYARMANVSEADAEAVMCANIPFGARGVPDDIASMIAFLASDEAGYVTGGQFTVDGGWTVRSAG
jgi:NAD(P)-dependent dehydrogenase (short-subunit alcohol dehydrogenase family)